MKQVHAEERRMLAFIAKRNEEFIKAKKAGEPEVGIFWLLPNGKVWMDGTPVSMAASYGDLKIHEGTHTQYWDSLQRNGIAPADVEYEEYPRGRVAYDAKKRQFFLFADACILKDKAAVSRIMNQFRLPSNTKKEKDPHYRCPKCMSSGRSKKQQEKDWDI